MLLVDQGTEILKGILKMKKITCFFVCLAITCELAGTQPTWLAEEVASTHATWCLEYSCSVAGTDPM